MKTEISTNEWMEIQHKVKQIDYWQECPPFASFSMAGTTHKLYSDGENIYESVGGNGFGVWYKYDNEDGA